MGAVPEALQLGQGVLIGSVPDPARQRAQAHKVTPLLPLLLQRSHAKALHGGGQFTCRKQEQSCSCTPLPAGRGEEVGSPIGKHEG